MQKAVRPFGGFAATRWGDDGAFAPAHVFASPGPIYEPEGARVDYWRLARALHAAGFRRGDLVHNTFSYHFTPAGSMMETAARALGCTVFPAGVGQTEQQVHAIADLAPDGYVGTPSFLRIILEKADEMGIALPSLRKATVSAEPFPPSLRDAWIARGIAGYPGIRDRRRRKHRVRDVRARRTGRRRGRAARDRAAGHRRSVAPGEVGEVVVTPIDNADYPLIRFGTGDLSAMLPGASPCGRTNVRIKGWMGRADQRTKVKGMFVDPSQVAAIVRRHPAIGRARLVVDNPDGNDRMTLHVEIAPGGDRDAIIATIRDVTKLRGDVAVRSPGELPNDGRVIDDVRKHD